MELSREYFIGNWKESNKTRMFSLASDGSAETRLGESECYPGTWGFGAPNKLLVRVVIPLNIPDVDDELNATEMGFTIHTFSPDSFTADEFDRDKDFTFVRDNG